MLISKNHQYIRWIGIIVILFLIIFLPIHFSSTSKTPTTSESPSPPSPRTSGGIEEETDPQNTESPPSGDGKTFNTSMLKQTNAFRKTIWGGDGFPLTIDDNLTKQAQAYADHIAKGFSKTKPGPPTPWDHGIITDDGPAALPNTFHFKAKFTGDGGFGQNMSWNYGGDKTAEGYIGVGPSNGPGSWGGECADCPKDGSCPIQGVTKTVGKDTVPVDTGHFTQLVWKDTKRVGCAKATMWKDQPQQRDVVVCNYYPRGNNGGTLAKNLPANNKTCPFPT